MYSLSFLGEQVWHICLLVYSIIFGCNNLGANILLCRNSSVCGSDGGVEIGWEGETVMGEGKHGYMCHILWKEYVNVCTLLFYISCNLSGETPNACYCIYSMYIYVTHVCDMCIFKSGGGGNVMSWLCLLLMLSGGEEEGVYAARANNI